jgi:hypothetical protein
LAHFGDAWGDVEGGGHGVEVEPSLSERCRVAPAPAHQLPPPPSPHAPSPLVPHGTAGVARVCAGGCARHTVSCPTGRRQTSSRSAMCARPPLSMRDPKALTASAPTPSIPRRRRSRTTTPARPPFHPAQRAGPHTAPHPAYSTRSFSLRCTVWRCVPRLPPRGPYGGTSSRVRRVRNGSDPPFSALCNAPPQLCKGAPGRFGTRSFERLGAVRVGGTCRGLQSALIEPSRLV